jgi:hypothetical protein
VLYSDAKFAPDWEGLDCPRVFVWVDPNCYNGTQRAREADAVFLFKPEYLPSAADFTAHCA